MSKIDEITIQKVKDAASVVDVLSDFLKLKKSGADYTCLCPFHNDRHVGSFKVSPRRNVYTCFSCGAHGTPVDYLMKHEGYKFIEAIQYLGKKYSIEVEGSEKFTPKPCKPRTPMPPLPMLELDLNKYLMPTISTDNALCRWIRTLPFDYQQKARIDVTLKNYAMGTSKFGHAIFWQIDENGKVRTGKMMQYKDDGHRDQDREYNFDWIHSSLIRNNNIDYESGEMVQTLYGMHLLRLAKPTTVNIVESEKTAILCTIMYGNITNQLWMATGGKMNLKREKLKPIIDRGISIVAYPDKDGEEEWKKLCKDIGYDKLTVNTSFMRMYWKPEDGEKADIADVLLRILSEKSKADNVAALKDLIAINPNIQTLINNLDLELEQ